MTKENQFWKGMLLGALAGGTISLLDKQTRDAMKENVQRTSSKVAYLVKHPGEVTEKVKETADKIRNTFEEVSEDIVFITDKVDELKELTPQVTGLIKETKDAFTENDEADLLEDVMGEGRKIIN